MKYGGKNKTTKNHQPIDFDIVCQGRIKFT